MSEKEHGVTAEVQRDDSEQRVQRGKPGAKPGKKRKKKSKKRAGLWYSPSFWNFEDPAR